MSFSFYPRKDEPCPNVGHCPHAGGAAIATLVQLSKEGTLDFAFFKDVRVFVKRACAFHHQRASGSLSEDEQRAEEFWMCERLKRLSTWSSQ